MTAIRSLNDRASEIGQQDREFFIAEFGTDPVVGEVGDWDSNGVTEAWITLQREFDLDSDGPEFGDRYQEARLAYLKALFATEDVG